MPTDGKKTHPLKRMLIRAAKFPLILLAISIPLIAFSYFDAIFSSLNKWNTVFNWTDELGDILLALSCATFVYSLIVLFCKKYERKLFDNNLVLSLILTSFRKGLRFIFVLVIINIIITMIGPTHISLILANNLINIVIIASIGWLAIQVLYTTETFLYKKMQTLTHDAHSRMKALYTKLHILRNIATVIIFIVTVAVILMSFSSVRNIGISLLASAGFLTALIGLAAQRTLFTLFAGLQIAFSQPIRLGDIVVIDKESGTIEQITLTYVTLKLGDHRRLVIPISYFIEKPFENWSHEGRSVRSSFSIFVDYMMPIEPLRNELDKILANSTRWDKHAKNLQVANITERAVEIRIQVSATNADDLSDLRAEVREKMLGFIQKHHAHHLPTVRMLPSKE